MINLMSSIVHLFHEAEERPTSYTTQLLRENFPAEFVASRQVECLLKLIARTGDDLLRSQFGVLLLMNVTRRVLAIVREAAASTKATPSELEKRAMEWLNEKEQEDSEESGREPSPSSATSPAPFGLTRAPSALPKPERRCMSVKFTDEAVLHGVRSASGLPLRDRGSPLLKRAPSVVVPGQQELRRIPSRRSTSVDDGDAAELFPVHTEKFYEEAQKGIDEFRDEVEGMTEELCRRARRQLHPSDTVLTIGCTHTTLSYLVQAAEEGVPLHVIILEGSPSAIEAVEALAAQLRQRQVTVDVLPDSDAFVVMSLCTKVLVSAESVLANGGMLAPVGAHMVCVAARHFAVPCLVATTTLKMSPYYPSDKLCTRLVRIARSGAQEIPWSTFGGPERVLPQPYGVSVPDGGRSFTVHAPVTEYVPPELIALYLTNETEFTPSQIHHFVRANYSDAD
ncbi:translation initiation factor eIF-2B subunit beta [Strigomonas culicis]|nr:translation initiation factor eIF-2B subunit beta [Strigomonas culicis]|eukprot:EPY33321.1 translation initiation factor eIF-2B subunit beta [Strigomonas culicis]